MISDFQRGSVTTIGELGSVNREWIKKGSFGSQMTGLQTQVTLTLSYWCNRYCIGILLHSHNRFWFFLSQLLFNNTVTASVVNRATRVGPPSPIIIEKLLPRTERQDDLESCGSSVRLSVLSEERLQAAVRLARRDLRRKRQESISCLSLEPAERSQSISPERSNIDYSPHVVHPKMSGPKKQLQNGAQVLVYTPQEPDRQLKQGQQPTKDLDPRVNSSEPQLTQEIRKLQKELNTYVQRIEQLAYKGILLNPKHP